MSTPNQRSADFVLVVDVTGSMQPCIDALKRNLSRFVSGLNSEQSRLTNWRGRVVGFRDFPADASTWLEDNPFTSDFDTLMRNLEVLRARGGGSDGPESLLDALHFVATAESNDSNQLYSWRKHREASRVVIAFTDAKYHPNVTYSQSGRGTGIAGICELLRDKGIILHIFAPDIPEYDVLSMVPKCEFHALAKPAKQSLSELSNNDRAFGQIMDSLVKSISTSASVQVSQYE